MADTDFITRYISLGKLIELLDSKTLHLGRIDFFEDKTEGEWYAHMAKTTNTALKLPENNSTDDTNIYLNPLIHSNHWYIKVMRKVMEVFDLKPAKLKSGEIKTDLS